MAEEGPSKTNDRRAQESVGRATARRIASNRGEQKSEADERHDALRFNDVDEQIKRFFAGVEL